MGFGWIVAPLCPESVIDFEMVTCSLNGTPVLHTKTVSLGFAAAIAAAMVVYCARQPTITPALLTTLFTPNSAGAPAARITNNLLSLAGEIVIFTFLI